MKKRILPFLFTVLVSSYAGKAQITSIDVKVHPEACDLGRATVTVNEGHGNFSYNWNDGNNGQDRQDLKGGSYLLTVLDLATGADSTVLVEIKKNRCRVYFTIVFSPNGDDINDNFTGNSLSLYPNFSLTIYNRWGQLVHEQKKTFVPWDGTFRGIPLPDDAYFWVFLYDANNSKDSESGSVTIIR